MNAAKSWNQVEGDWVVDDLALRQGLTVLYVADRIDIPVLAFRVFISSTSYGPDADRLGVPRRLRDGRGPGRNQHVSDEEFPCCSDRLSWHVRPNERRSQLRLDPATSMDAALGDAFWTPVGWLEESTPDYRTRAMRSSTGGPRSPERFFGWAIKALIVPRDPFRRLRWRCSHSDQRRHLWRDTLAPWGS